MFITYYIVIISVRSLKHKSGYRSVVHIQLRLRLNWTERGVRVWYTVVFFSKSFMVILPSLSGIPCACLCVGTLNTRYYICNQVVILHTYSRTYNERHRHCFHCMDTIVIYNIKVGNMKPCVHQWFWKLESQIRMSYNGVNNDDNNNNG